MKKTLYLILFICVFSCEQKPNNIKLSGPVFGTSYSVIYESRQDYTQQFDSLFYVLNKSMSTYQVNSDISKINRNESNIIDEHFQNVFSASKVIYKLTEGAFDPTIGSIVNAWDFGPEEKIVNLDSLKIDSLMLNVGLNKVQINDNKIKKQNPEIYIDFNAIAKGYAVDVLSEFLESRNVNNYLVEIGGEIRCKGQNIVKQNAWTVGIDKPNFDGTQSIMKAVQIEDEAMATSGTYRKFKIDENGKRYAHIIDTKTGYPSQTNLLGISVIAEDCMTADAYATAFKTMGINNVKHFLQSHPELQVFLIFENEIGELETMNLNGFPDN